MHLKIHDKFLICCKQSASSSVQMSGEQAVRKAFGSGSMTNEFTLTPLQDQQIRVNAKKTTTQTYRHTQEEYSYARPSQNDRCCK